VLLGAANAVINRILDEDDDSVEHERFSYLFEAAIYFTVMLIAIIISSLLIRTVKTERSSLWPKVKNEILAISIIIVITYIIKFSARIYIYL
jgi:hypothetical protein